MKTIFTLFLLLIPVLSFPQEDNSEYYKILINTGEKPECIFCKPKFDYSIDNFLKIDASSASDLVIKVIDSQTHECVRTTFIKGGDIHYITNIPQGIYYLKIAYGYDWSKKVAGSFCFAKFVTDAHYQKGNELMDYYLKKTSNGYQWRNYELILRVYSKSRKNEFDADDISEEQFYE